jgi:hypothetical protein
VSTPPPPYQPPVGHPAYAAAPYPQAAPVGVLSCEVCGAAPAGPVTVRGHQGMIVVMRNLRRQGVFCRNCGTAVFRHMQANTMLAGWWGPLSVIITAVTLLMNLGARSAILSLPEPTTPAVRPGFDPGKPVMKRPAGMVALIPMTLFALLLVSLIVLMIIGAVTGGSSS